MRVGLRSQTELRSKVRLQLLTELVFICYTDRCMDIYMHIYIISSAVFAAAVYLESTPFMYVYIYRTIGTQVSNTDFVFSNFSVEINSVPL